MKFSSRLWDPINQVASELARGPWRRFRDATFDTLGVLRDITGQPNVERHDHELAAFAFSLLQVAVDETVPGKEEAAQIAQQVAAGVYHQLPRGNVPEPNLFWAFLCHELRTYRQCIAARAPSMKYVSVVEQFLRRYDLVGADGAAVIRGFCEALAPEIRRTRRFLRERYEVI